MVMVLCLSPKRPLSEGGVMPSCVYKKVGSLEVYLYLFMYVMLALVASQGSHQKKKKNR